jgi:hypothetical protein
VLCVDSFERTPILNSGEGALAWFNEFFGREAWRFVLVQTDMTQQRPHVRC